MGFDYIRNHPFVKRLFVYYAVLFVLVSPVAFLTPLQVTRSFGPDVWRLTAVEIAFSVGMMGGGAVIAAWGGFKNRIYTMAMASVMVGAGTLALGVTSLFGLYLAFMGLTGLAVPLFNTPATVLLQEKVEEDYLGRVFGVLTMISTSMMPLGMLFFGPLADHIQIEWVLLATGTMLAAQGFFLLGSRKLLREGYKPGNHIQ
jgi:DHA3 family macrolide efflux protein-like MFS transporter